MMAVAPLAEAMTERRLFGLGSFGSAPGAGGDAERGVRPGGDDLVQGDGGAAAGDAVDGADRPGDPVPVADVFRDDLREDADVEE